MNEDLYRAPQAELIDPQRAQALALAPRGTRLLATIVDQLVLLPAFVPMLIGLAGSLGSNMDASELPAAALAGIALSALLALGVGIVDLFLMARDGQTIAKRWFGIRVVRSDGSPLSLGRYLALRVLPVNLLAQVPLVGILVALADPLLIFRENQKCLHDEIADTIVVMA